MVKEIGKSWKLTLAWKINSSSPVPKEVVPKWDQFWGGSTLDPIPTPDPYLGCNFLTLMRVHSVSSSSPIYVSPKIMYGGSTLDLDPAPDPYLCCTLWGSTSHLRSCGAIVLSMKDPMLSSKLNISSHISVYQYKPYYFTFQVKFW